MVKLYYLTWIDVNENKIVGGIEDIGNYKEGYCFRLQLKTSAIWNICSDSHVIIIDSYIIARQNIMDECIYESYSRNHQC